MTCQEFELALGREESSAEVDAHLETCSACRELASEMRANSEALWSFSSEALPSVRGAVMAAIRRPTPMIWEWVLAAAALLALTLGVSRMWRVEQMSMPRIPVAVAPQFEIPAPQPIAAPKPVRRKNPPALTVKMLTSDPDVVIYWLIETKEGTE